MHDRLVADSTIGFAVGKIQCFKAEPYIYLRKTYKGRVRYAFQNSQCLDSESATVHDHELKYTNLDHVLCMHKTFSPFLRRVKRSIFLLYHVGIQ